MTETLILQINYLVKPKAAGSWPVGTLALMVARTASLISDLCLG